MKQKIGFFPSRLHNRRGARTEQQQLDFLLQQLAVGGELVADDLVALGLLRVSALAARHLLVPEPHTPAHAAPRSAWFSPHNKNNNNNNTPQTTHRCSVGFRVLRDKKIQVRSTAKVESRPRLPVRRVGLPRRARLGCAPPIGGRPPLADKRKKVFFFDDFFSFFLSPLTAAAAPAPQAPHNHDERPCRCNSAGRRAAGAQRHRGVAPRDRQVDRVSDRLQGAHRGRDSRPLRKGPLAARRRAAPREKTIFLSMNFFFFSLFFARR